MFPRIKSNTELNWKEIVLAYKDLWQIEAVFRTLKSELECPCLQ